MAVERLGVAGMAPEMKQFYDRLLLSVAEKNLVFMNYGEKRPIPARGGKSIEFRRFEKFVVNEGSYTLTEGTSPLEMLASINTVAATISQYGAFSKLSDVLETQAFDTIIAEYTRKMGIHMAETLDYVVRDVVDASTTIQYADASTSVGTSVSGAVGSGMYMDAAEILEAKRTLRRADAKPVVDDKYVLIIHPDNEHDLFQDADIVGNFQYARERGPNNPLFRGELGDWMGVRFVVTSNLKVNSSYGMSGADVYECVMLGKEAYAVTELSAQQARTIIHPRGSGGHLDPLEQYSTIGWKAALAAVILNQNFLVVIMCASSRTPAA